MKSKGKRYSSNFKYNAMAAWASGKYRSEADLAFELGIPLKTLREWRKKQQPQCWQEYRDSLTSKKEKLSQDKLIEEWENSIQSYCNISNNTEDLLKRYLDEIINETDQRIKDLRISRLTDLINLAIRSQTLKSNALGIGTGRNTSKFSEGSISIEEHNRIITNFVEVMLNVLANNVKNQHTLNQIITQVSTYQKTMSSNKSIRRVK